MADDEGKTSNEGVEEARGFLDATLFAEVCAVVGAEDDDCVVHQPKFPNPVEEAADPEVGERYLSGVEALEGGDVFWLQPFLVHAVTEEKPLYGILVVVHFLESLWRIPGLVGIEHLQPEHERLASHVALEPSHGEAACSRAEVIVLESPILRV